MITATRSAELDAMLNRLEARYEAQTERLARLTARRRDRKTAVYDLAEITGCRRELAETARLLQRMADRDFGSCRECAGEIPVAHLTARPEVTSCPACEEAVPA